MTKEIIQLDSNLDFSNLSPELFKNTVDHFIEKIQNKVNEITQMSKEDITWENSMKELDHLEQQFSRVLSIVSHLTGVTENKPLDKAYEECIPSLVEHSSKIGQNKDLMIALASLKEKELNDVQIKVLEEELKSFKHAGIDLSEEKQKELNQINERLQILGNTFKNNITDTVSEYSMEVTAEEIEGVPESLLSIFKEFAAAEEKENYVVKLIAPYHFEVMKYLKNREMRKKIHKASATVASKELIEKYDNEPILNEIVKKNNPDLVLMGKQAIDDDSNQTGQMLAALLGWPQGTFVSKLEINSQEINVTREIDGGLETLTIKLPAVVTTDLRLNEPRYASLPNIMKAKQKPIERIKLNNLNVDTKQRIKILEVTEPQKKKAGIKVKDVEELISKLHNDEKVI